MLDGGAVRAACVDPQSRHRVVQASATGTGLVFMLTLAGLSKSLQLYPRKQLILTFFFHFFLVVVQDERKI